jgi:hypothetical protein
MGEPATDGQCSAAYFFTASFFMPSLAIVSLPMASLFIVSLPMVFLLHRVLAHGVLLVLDRGASFVGVGRWCYSCPRENECGRGGGHCHSNTLAWYGRAV